MCVQPSRRGVFCGGSSWGFFGSIRTCQIPIGRAQPKNWNLWLCHIKQRSGKKVDRILCWWYRDWWQSYRERGREMPKCVFLLLESKEWPKKGTRQPKKIAKNIKIGVKRLAVGAFWTSPGPKCTEKQDLQPRNRDIAPKPLKWRFKKDFMVKKFSKKNQKISPMRIQNRHCHILSLFFALEAWFPLWTWPRVWCAP